MNCAPGLAGLATLFTVAITLTVPETLCAGAVTVQLVELVQLTTFAAAFPNLKIVPLVAVLNPVPVTVTTVPPAIGPSFGLSDSIVGVNLKRSLVVIALVPAVFVTRTSTIPALFAGAVAVIDVVDLTV